jgi:hypothetical protein
MDTPFQLVMMAAEVLGAGLVAAMLYRGTYKLRPCFFAFALCLVVTSAAQFAFYYVRTFTRAEYAAAYWVITATETAFGLAAVSELLNFGRVSILMGVTVGTLALRFPEWHFGGIACVALLLLSVGATIRGVYENHQTPAGFVLLYFMQTLAYLPRLPYEARFLPVIAWMMASWFWWEEIHSPSLG